PRHRSPDPAAPSISISAPAAGAVLPGRVVARPALAGDRRAGVARGGSRPQGRASGDRHRYRWLRRGAGGVARAKRRPSDGAARTERVPRRHTTLALTARATSAPRIPGSAASTVARTAYEGVRLRQSDHATGPSGCRRRTRRVWSHSGAPHAARIRRKSGRARVERDDRAHAATRLARRRESV